MNEWAPKTLITPLTLLRSFCANPHAGHFFLGYFKKYDKHKVLFKQEDEFICFRLHARTLIPLITTVILHVN